MIDSNRLRGTLLIRDMIKEIKIAYVEDDDLEAEKVKKYIDKYCFEYGLESTINRFDNGETFINNYKFEYDLVLMDMVMPIMGGMEASIKLREIDDHVALILITNMIHYAIKGYEVNALDFILKPVTYFDLELRLEKALSYISKNQDRKITIETNNSSKIISIKDILFIEVMNHKLYYHIGEDVFETYGQLKEVEKVLAPFYFKRSNNSFLVNLRNVNEIHSTYITAGKQKIPISRRKRKEFLEELNHYLGGTF